MISTLRWFGKNYMHIVLGFSGQTEPVECVNKNTHTYIYKRAWASECVHVCGVVRGIYFEELA